jgi:hypothetical protein
LAAAARAAATAPALSVLLAPVEMLLGSMGPVLQGPCTPLSARARAEAGAICGEA